MAVVRCSLSHLSNAVHKGAVGAHDARRELAVDRVQHALRLRRLLRQVRGGKIG